MESTQAKAGPLKTRKKIPGWVFLVGTGFLACIYALLYIFPLPPRQLPSGMYPRQFQISRETTVITEPLDEDGFPDYELALNRHFSKGVDPEQNAVVTLQGAIGPTPWGKAIDPVFYEWLKTKSPPGEGEYFIPFPIYWKQADPIDFAKIRPPLGTTWERALAAPWVGSDFPIVRQWLDKQEVPLAIVESASRKSQFFSPLVNENRGTVNGGFSEAKISSTAMLPEICKALICRAMFKVGKRQFQESINDVMVCHSLTRLARFSSDVEFLLALQMEKMTLQADQVLLASADLSIPQLKEWKKQWDQLKPSQPLEEILDTGTRFHYLQLATFLNKYGFENMDIIYGAKNKDENVSTYGLANVHFDSFLIEINQWMDRITQAVKGNEVSERKQAVKEVWKSYKERNKDGFFIGNQLVLYWSPRYYQGLAKGKLLGLNLFALNLFGDSPLFSLPDEVEENRRLFSLALNLAIYKGEKGAYPDELKDLVPTYLKTIPEDLFSGKSPVYRRTNEGFQLYSVGPNGQDDGGNGKGDEIKGDDLVFRIPKGQKKP